VELLDQEVCQAGVANERVAEQEECERERARVSELLEVFVGGVVSQRHGHDRGHTMQRDAPRKQER